MRARRCGLAVTAFAVLVSCSGGGDVTANSAVVLTVPMTDPMTVPTTVPATVPITVPATDQTTVPATEPTTTAAPVPTTLDAVTLVGQAWEAYLAAYVVCGDDPASCDISTLALPGSEKATGLAVFFGKLAKEGLRVKSGPIDKTVVEAIVVAPDGLTATMKMCFVDSGIIYDPRDPATPDDDAIVNDAIAYGRSEWHLALVDGIWRIVDAANTEDHAEDRCG